MQHIEPDRRERGTALLLAHCDAVGRLTSAAPAPAFERLAMAVGPELARRLVGAVQASASRP